ALGPPRKAGTLTMPGPGATAAAAVPRRTKRWSPGPLTIGLAVAALLAALPLSFDNSFLLTVGALILLNAIGAVSLHLIIRTGHISLAHAAFMGVGGYACVLSVMRLGIPPVLGLFVGMA